MEDERPGFWAVLPAAVRYDPELPPMARLLYAEISALTDQRGYCFAPNTYFLKLYKISERTLQEHLRALKKGGYISIVNGEGGAGRRRIYAGINPLTQNPADFCGDPREKLRGNPAEICAQNNKGNKKKEQIPPKAPQGAPAWKPERFLGFWNFYPVHKSKQAAIRAWDRLKPSDELIAYIGKALTRQKQSEEWTREDARIPYAATYLNQMRWEDEEFQQLPRSRAPASREEVNVWL